MKRKIILLICLLVICSIVFSGLFLEIGLRLIFTNGYFQYRPEKGIHTTYEYTYHIKINSWGIRDREFTKKELRFRKILFLGDSMTYGHGVEVYDTFPKIVEKKISKTYPNLLVINGGGLGTSTYGQFKSLKLLMNKHDFNAVGFCFYLGNDADNKLFFPIDRHLNEEGHQLIAEMLINFLFSENII